MSDNDDERAAPVDVTVNFTLQARLMYGINPMLDDPTVVVVCQVCGLMFDPSAGDEWGGLSTKIVEHAREHAREIYGRR